MDKYIKMSINGDVKTYQLLGILFFKNIFCDEMKSLFGWDPLPYVTLCHFFSQPPTPYPNYLLFECPLGNSSNEYSMIIFVQLYFLKKEALKL